MPSWWKKQTARIDAFVAGGVTLCIFWWFGQVLQLAGTAALYCAVFGALQLLRFVGAQLAELQWVRMHEALLREQKAPAPAAARGDGYREAAVVVEDPPTADDERLEQEVRTRGRRAKVSLGVACALAWALAAVPGFLASQWFPLEAASLAAGAIAMFSTMVYAWRLQDAKRKDFFRQHLDRDTKAMLDPKPRVRVEDAQLRAGVDFGVPPQELEAVEELEDAKKQAR